MIRCVLANHPKEEVLYDPLLDDYASSEIVCLYDPMMKVKSFKIGCFVQSTFG